jgi:hypothetical protein
VVFVQVFELHFGSHLLMAATSRNRQTLGKQEDKGALELCIGLQACNIPPPPPPCKLETFRRLLHLASLQHSAAFCSFVFVLVG